MSFYKNLTISNLKKLLEFLKTATQKLGRGVMGLIDNLERFDPSRDALTSDFELVAKSSLEGRSVKLISQPIVNALQDYVRTASAEQKTRLEQAASAARGRLTAVKHVIKEDDGGYYKKIRPLFTAAHGLSAAAPPPADRAHIEAINRAFHAKLTSDVATSELPDIVEGLLFGILLSSKPISETQLHAIAGCAEHYPALFSKVPEDLVLHITRTSITLQEGNFQRATGNVSSGVYFGIHGGKRYIVVKPALEEYKTPFHPNKEGFVLPSGKVVEARGKIGTPVRSGHVSGEAAGRECIAYTTDLMDGHFAKTAPSLLVQIRHRSPMVKEGTSPYKIANIQAFVPGRVMEQSDYAHLNKQDLERVAYADIDEGNADRHFKGNLFVQEGGGIQRIDQGLTRGSAPDSCSFGWRNLPQLAHPLTAATKEHIQQQDIGKRIHILRSFGLSEEAIKLEEARILLKKKGVEKGLTFYDLSAILAPRQGADASSTQCEFTDIMRRAAESCVEAEIDRAVTTVAQWKAHVAALHQDKPTEAWAIARASPYPHLRDAMIVHLKRLEGKL